MATTWWRRRTVRILGVVYSLLATQTDALYTLNGWHACAMDIGSDSSAASDISAECATVTMPLCHSDVCSDSETRTVDVFVKRIAANSTTSTRNLWVIPDHPTAMSVKDAERQMIFIYHDLLGDVSVYLMDQRGTGRSTLFDCEASQATSTVSKDGVVVAASEVATCVSALRASFGDSFAAAFSLTSAARDLVTFISTFQAKTKVFLYGVGYGTQLVERAMQFPSDEVIGFVLDSVATTSGGKIIEFPFRSRGDKTFGSVAKEFLSSCSDDSGCASHFDGDELTKVTEKVLAQVDDSSSPCSSIITRLKNSSVPASTGLRRLLAFMLQDTSLRTFIPVVLYRLKHCLSEDLVLDAFVQYLQSTIASQSSEFVASRNVGASLLVFDLIQFSELWESPPPSQNELQSRFSSSLFSPGFVSSQLERYCAFTLDSTSACSGFSYASAKDTKPLSYSRDVHWNAAAKIPSKASVLLLNSRFDGETPLESATVLYGALVGTSKELLVFNSAAHNVLVSTPYTVEDRSLEVTPSCARSILVSYVNNDADLKSYDTSCMAKLPKSASFNISTALSQEVLGVSEPYTGVFQSNGTSSGSGTHTIVIPPTNNTSDDDSLKSSRDRYRIAFILLLILSIILLVIVIALVYRAYKKRLLEDEELQLRKLQGEEEFDDMGFLRDLYNPSPSEWFNFRSNRLHL